MAKLLCVPIRDVWQMVRLENTSITTMEIQDNGDFEVVRWADDSHLPDQLKNANVKVAGIHNTSFDATAILNYRKMLKAAGEEYAGITLGDIILYAVSRTLKNHPDLNAHMLDDNSIRLFTPYTWAWLWILPEV